MRKIGGLLCISFVSMLLLFSSTGEATILDFDNLAIGTYVDTEYEDLGVTFNPGGVIYLFDPGHVLGLETGRIRAQFTGDVYTVGMNYKSESYLWLEAYDASGSQIGQVKASSLEGYFSLSTSEKIAEVSIHDSGYSFSIDNFMFSAAVPEESTYLLLGIGILSLTCLKRKIINV